MHKNWAGTLIEDDEGFHFKYEKEYLGIRNTYGCYVSCKERTTNIRSSILNFTHTS